MRFPVPQPANVKISVSAINKISFFMFSVSFAVSPCCPHSFQPKPGSCAVLGQSPGKPATGLYQQTPARSAIWLIVTNAGTLRDPAYWKNDCIKAPHSRLLLYNHWICPVLLLLVDQCKSIELICLYCNCFRVIVRIIINDRPPTLRNADHLIIPVLPVNS